MVKWISYGPPKAGFQVQFLTGGPYKKTTVRWFFFSAVCHDTSASTVNLAPVFAFRPPSSLPIFYQDLGRFRWKPVDRNWRKSLFYMEIAT